MPSPEGSREPRAGLLETVRAVAASFFGVRGGRAHERDMQRLDPVKVVVVGLLLAAAFVAALLFVVRLVVA